jgi:pyruvate/2-oxoglutarate dehydrogenase complex dihydrolipoamide dehydrogenase (E3) component
MSDRYDLVIVGAGSGGLSAAMFAVQLGARTAIVERNLVGGDCTWTGCVPSKTLLKTAKVAHVMRTAEHFGLSSADPQVDFTKVMEHVRGVVGEIAAEESPEVLRSNGIEVVLGDAKFVDPHTLVAGDTILEARRFLVTTGAHPFIPPIIGLEDVDYQTYETIWDLDALPCRLLVVGGGPLGCEMAQAFQRLGTSVTILTTEDRLLPRDDPDASRVLGDVFDGEGIKVAYNTRVERAWQDREGVYIGTKGSEFMGDALLLASGRRPTVAGLDLEKAGVLYDQRGIKIDDNLRTNQRHIYAAGDCTGDLQFTHYAGWQATLAVRNALLPGTSRGVTDKVPWTTFTDPEVAHIGMLEVHAREKFGDSTTCKWPMARVDRARTDGNTAGFIKLVHKKDGTLLGATIVATRAGEMIHEWIVALTEGIKVGQLSNAIHVYPSYSIAAQQAAAAIRIDRLLHGTSGKLVRGLIRQRR